MKLKTSDLKNKNLLIYGLGTTGKSVLRYFRKKKFKQYSVWDDDNCIRKSNKIKITRKRFIKNIDKYDYIIISPGINLKQQLSNKTLNKISNKVITDLDLFFLQNKKVKTIAITGTNGKSTTCKILEHVLKKNKKKVNLCGNIGRPILDQKIYTNSNVIIELSSFQLFYSKFLKLDISMILNLKKDHIDWHSSFKKYKEAKFRIFRNQKKSSHALLNEKGLIKYYNKNKFIPKLKKTLFSNIKNLRFESQHLNSKVNKENLSFVFDTIKLLGINKKNFITSLKNYKGLEHRQEYFHKIGKTKFINDSKATNFESAKNAISNYKNIYWIVGGQPKINEIFSLKRLKKNILKAYIIGNHQSFFKQKLHNQIDIIISKNLKKALKDISYDIRINNKVEDKTVLLSPASASFDQFRNFEDRGNIFKKIVRSYGKKSF